MIKVDLMSLTEKDPYITKIKTALIKATGQHIAKVNILPIKRTGGVSYRGAEMALSGGQKVTFLVRQDGDIYRVQLNDKDLPLAGDLSPDNAQSFNASMKEIASTVVNGQIAFQKKQAIQKVVVPRSVTTTKTAVQNLQDVLNSEKELDEVIQAKTSQLALLKEQLAHKESQVA